MMDLVRNKKLNRLVNIIYKIQGDNIYFSLEKMTISDKDFEGAIKLSKLPVFDSAEKILSILEENNIEFEESKLKII